MKNIFKKLVIQTKAFFVCKDSKDCGDSITRMLKFLDWLISKSLDLILFLEEKIGAVRMFPENKRAVIVDKLKKVKDSIKNISDFMDRIINKIK